MVGKDLRIIYMGTPDFAVAPLRALVEGGYNVVAVVTMPDKPAGRGLKLRQSAVKEYAMQAGLPVLQPERMKDPEFVERFRALDADLGIVIAFRMLPEVIWSAPKYGTFNLHASLLPQYRGAAPINWAIINGEAITGVTTFLLNPQIDEGAILGQREVDILPEDNAGTLHDRLMETGTGLVLETVDMIAAGCQEPIRQDTLTSEPLKPAPKIFREDCRIDFNRSGKDIVNLVRGLSPYPAAWAALQASLEQMAPIAIKIFDARYRPVSHSSVPGTIRTNGKDTFTVACADGYVDIFALQAAGKKRMATHEFLLGFRNLEAYHL